jgi:uncharacterized protein YqgV (UPF0045/DUF77 family)
MVFEFVFPAAGTRNGFSSYIESLAPTSGVEIIEQCPSATVVEGEWDAAMKFLRHCQDYMDEHCVSGALTTVHIHG